MTTSNQRLAYFCFILWKPTRDANLLLTFQIEQYWIVKSALFILTPDCKSHHMCYGTALYISLIQNLKRRISVMVAPLTVIRVKRKLHEESVEALGTSIALPLSLF
jgi:hypothetical protein